jgi:hypothetical protein
MADNPTDPEISNTAPGRMPGRWTARVALLMSVVAATLAGYLSYTLIYLQPIAAQEYKTQQAIEVLEQRVLAEMDTALLETQARAGRFDSRPSGRKPRCAEHIGERGCAESGGSTSK